jgi:hypothetical protein
LLLSGFDPIVLIDEEGVGETSGQRPDPTLEMHRASQEQVRQKKQAFFSRCGSLTVRNFTSG